MKNEICIHEVEWLDVKSKKLLTGTGYRTDLNVKTQIGVITIVLYSDKKLK